MGCMNIFYVQYISLELCIFVYSWCTATVLSAYCLVGWRGVIPAPHYLKIGDKLFSSVWLTSSPALQKVNINVLILCFTDILMFREYFVKMCVFLSGLRFHLCAVIHRNVDQLRQCSYYIVGHSVRHWTLWAMISTIAAILCSMCLYWSMSVQLIPAPYQKCNSGSAKITMCRCRIYPLAATTTVGRLIGLCIVFTSKGLSTPALARSRSVKA